MIWKTSQNSQINKRSSHPDLFNQEVLSKAVLRNFAKFTDNYFGPGLFFNKVAHWCFTTSRSIILYKIGAFGLFTKFTVKNLCWSLFLIKLQFWGPATLLKKTPTQVLSCEICKLFKNNYFEEHLWMSASKLYLKRDSNTGVFPWILWVIQEHLICRGSTNGWFWNTSARVSL